MPRICTRVPAASASEPDVVRGRRAAGVLLRVAVEALREDAHEDAQDAGYGPRLFTVMPIKPAALRYPFWYTAVKFKTNTDGLLFVASTIQLSFYRDMSMSLRRGVTRR